MMINSVPIYQLCICGIIPLFCCFAADYKMRRFKIMLPTVPRPIFCLHNTSTTIKINPMVMLAVPKLHPTRRLKPLFKISQGE